MCTSIRQVGPVDEPEAHQVAVESVFGRGQPGQRDDLRRRCSGLDVLWRTTGHWGGEPGDRPSEPVEPFGLTLGGSALWSPLGCDISSLITSLWEQGVQHCVVVLVSRKGIVSDFCWEYSAFPRVWYCIPVSPSSSVVAANSAEEGPVPALLLACTTTPYWVNFFRLSSTRLSALSPVVSMLITLNW